MSSVLRAASVGLLGVTLSTACSERTHGSGAPPRPSRIELTLASVVPPSGSAPETARSPEAPTQPGVPSPRPARSNSAVLAFDPDPVVVCSKTGLGTATVNWKAPGVEFVEIRMGSPNGTLFAEGKSDGSAKTENWVSSDIVFFLQDVTNGAPRDEAHTLVSARPRTVPGPCN